MPADPSSGDFYKRLGVAPDAKPEEIKAAFRAMRKELHPDSRPESLRGHFNRMMQNVN
jgi:DnaJ-class molecular chaperone